MKKIAIFYGSSTGNTKSVAHSIADKLSGFDVHLADISNAAAEHLTEFSCLIFGTSTWGYGDIQDDWESFLPKLKKVDLKGKSVALFGLGDGEAYPDTFVDGIADIYDAVLKGGAQVVGQVSTDGYNFSESRAVKGGVFVGLPLDEDNQSNLTNQRLEVWVGELKSCIC